MPLTNPEQSVVAGGLYQLQFQGKKVAYTDTIPSTEFRIPTGAWVTIVEVGEGLISFFWQDCIVFMFSKDVIITPFEQKSPISPSIVSEPGIQS